MTRPAQRSRTWIRLLPAFLLTSSALFAACSERRETCVLEEGEAGLYHLRCPDGSSGTFFSPDSREAPARVEGRARRIGDKDASGIEVILEPTSPSLRTYQVLTDEEGNYVFEDVAPGTYHLVFRAASYPTQVLWQRTILPGTLRLDPVVLRPSFRISNIPPSQILVSPKEDALVALEEMGGSLLYWDEADRGEARVIGIEAARPMWLPGGEKVLFLEQFSFEEQSGSLVLYDRRRGTSESIMEEVDDWAVSADEEVIVARQRGSLSLWSAKTRETTSLVGRRPSSWDFHPESKIVVASFHSNRDTGQPDIMVWDALAGTGSLFGPADSLNHQFDLSGELLLFEAEGSSILWSRQHRTHPKRFAVKNQSAIMSPSGRFIIFRNADRIEAYVIESGTYREIATSLGLDGFDPRNGNYWMVEPSRRRLLVYDGEDVAEVDTWDANQSFIWMPLFPKGSEKFYYVLRDGAGMQTLHSWAPGRPGAEIARDVKLWPRLVGNDTHLLYQTSAPYLVEIETGKVTRLRETAALALYLGTHESGVLHYPITPLFSTSPEVVGPMVIHDLENNEEKVLVDEIKQEACRFAEGGALFCLNRRSPIGPRGAQLIRWERNEGEVLPLADGVLGFGFATSGPRAWFASQAVNDETAPLLWLYDPALEAPVAIEEGFSQVALTDSWIAVTIDEGPRAGLHISLYPRPPAGQNP